MSQEPVVTTNSNLLRRSLITTTYALLLVGAIALITLIPNALVQAKNPPAHVAADLSEINVNDGFAELVKAVKPAVVNISVTGRVKSPGSVPGFNGGLPQLEEFMKRFFGDIPDLPQFNRPNKGPNNGGAQPYERKTTAVGSGFVIDSDGLVVTNHHVIEHADEIEVVFDDGSRIPATLQGTDPKTDLALLKIDVDRPLPYVVFGDSDEARVGDWVVAIGNPFGLGGTTTSGIISARGRDIQSGPLDDFIQIDASINRGNSGGPLFNTKGEVIGVNSAIYSPNGGSVGIGFAIPSSMADNVIVQLSENGSVQRGYLGVHIQALNQEIAENLGLEDSSGALVTQVVENSPAEEAGVEPGDVILTFDGKTLSKMRDLPKFVALTDKGKQVDMQVWRNDELRTLNVLVGGSEQPQLAESSPSSESGSQLGLQLAELNVENARKYGLDENAVGVIIVDVDPQSSAAQKGLRPGDVIKRIGKKDVASPDEAVDAIEDTKQSEKSVLFLVERNNQARFVVVPVKA